MKVAALAGGVGGAKLLVGLQRVLGGGDLTAIVNTGDDASIYGVHVSPDVDIVTYWLAGIADVQRGWGIRGDTFRVVESLRALGADAWFNLGDRDFATCIHRSERLRAGESLSSITRSIRTGLGVPTDVIPMSDDPVRTYLHTRDGRVLEFQEYFVRLRHEPVVDRVEFRGAHDARPAPGVVDAIVGADIVVICPSNPLLSIAPILAVPDVRRALTEHPNVVAVTPIIRGAALKGPADRLLAQVGLDASASGVARYYADFCDVFVVDATDADEIGRAHAHGQRAIALPTVMTDEESAARLADALLDRPGALSA